MAYNSEEYRGFSRVETYVDRNTMDKFCRRMELEGIEKNKDGRFPIDDVVRMLIKTYAEGTYTIIKNPPKTEHHAKSTGVDYKGSKE